MPHSDFLLGMTNLLEGPEITCGPLIDWISDTRSQGYTNLQSLLMIMLRTFRESGSSRAGYLLIVSITPAATMTSHAAGLLCARCFSNDNAIKSCCLVAVASLLGCTSEVLCTPRLLSESVTTSSGGPALALQYYAAGQKQQERSKYGAVM